MCGRIYDISRYSSSYCILLFLYIQSLSCLNVILMLCFIVHCALATLYLNSHATKATLNLKEKEREKEKERVKKREKKRVQNIRREREKAR